MEEHILLVDDDPRTCKVLDACLAGWDWGVWKAENAAQASDSFTRLGPALLIISAEAPDAIKFLETAISHDPEIQAIMICERDRLAQVMEGLRDKATDFMTRPLNTVALEISLNRARRFIRMRRRLEAAKEDTDAAVCEKMDKKVDTERFVAVRQIVDKLSLFISKIANDAQGGVRYFNEMPYFVSIHSRDCKVLATNPAYKTHLGNKIYHDSWEVYGEHQASQKACPVGRTVATGNVMSTRAAVRYLSGARVPVIVHTSPVFNDDGEVELVLEVFAGTKEIDHLSKEISSTQQRYQQLFDAVPCYVAVLDLKLRLATFNRRFRDGFGDHTGQIFFDIFRQVSPPREYCPISQTLRDGMSHQSEMVLTAQTGEPCNVLAWTSPIKTAAGKLIQVLVIFADITEVRKLQDNLSSLGLMIGTISHNLKGSLTGLDAGLYLIETGFYRDKPGRIEEGLDVAKLMAERIRRLVYDILYYVKEREIEPEQMDVFQFVSDVAANIETRIRGADIAFHCDFPPDAGDFEADPGLLRSALTNILENAMEACIEDEKTASHHIDFKVSTDRDGVMFEIADNGAGMAEAQMKNMFSLFYSSKGRKGTGLGLFITHKVIRKHGGSISVNSRPGGGACFSIRLPRKLSGIPR